MDNIKWTLEDEIDYVTKQIADGEDIGHNTSAHQQLLFSWLKELKDLRKKVEDGRLVELPVKVGDIAYLVSKIKGIRMFEIAEIRVLIDEYTKMIQVRDIFGKWWSVNNDNVFLPKEEAEARLAELRGRK